MKKGLYIFIVGIGLVAVSCQKQEVVPVSNERDVVPVWFEASGGENARGGDGSWDPNAQGENAAGSESGNSGDGEIPDSGGEITDPNNPTEGSGNSGKGRK